MDIRFYWIHGYLDTLHIKFFHYPDFGYPIQVSRYFWILFLNYRTWKKGNQTQVLRLFSMFILSIDKVRFMIKKKYRLFLAIATSSMVISHL